MVSRGQKALASALVATVFFYFLIFAQFAFLRIVEGSSDSNDWLQPIMLTMGIGGVAGALLTGKLFAKFDRRVWLLIGYAGCLLVALTTGLALPLEVMLIVALFLGVFLGSLTVSVVPTLMELLDRKRAGTSIGWGVGLAYGACNVPYVFEASPFWQSGMAAIVCAIGITLVGLLPREAFSGISTDRKSCVERRLFWVCVLIFMLLVWLDSAAFYVIQQQSDLKADSWIGSSRLWANAVAHLSMAIISGKLIDGGMLKVALLGALLFLVLGGYFIENRIGTDWALGSLLYVSGVSLYSTGLVAYCAVGGNWQDRSGVAWRVGILFSVAGWMGSGLGIGMARDLEGIPRLFLFFAIGAGFLLFGIWSNLEKGGKRLVG